MKTEVKIYKSKLFCTPKLYANSNFVTYPHSKKSYALTDSFVSVLFIQNYFSRVQVVFRYKSSQL